MRERFGRLGKELRSRARSQARWLIRDHGERAEAIITAKLRQPDVGASDRYRYQCTVRELRRLRRIDAERDRQSGAFVIGSLPAFGLGFVFAKLLGRKRRRSR